MWGADFLEGYFSDPLYWSMMNSVGMSRRYLQTLAVYALLECRMQFLELFYITLGYHYGLEVIGIPEFHNGNLVAEAYATCEDIKKYPTHWVHPHKSIHYDQSDFLSCILY